MAWGSLKTWITNELVTAAMMNEQVRDKFAELFQYQQKGDLMVAAGASALGRLAVGANGQALVADSAQALGVKWGQVAPLAGYVERTGPTWSSASTNYTEVFGANQCSFSLQLPVISTLYGWCSGVFRPTELYGRCSIKIRLDATDSAMETGKSCNSSATDISWTPFSLVWRQTGVTAGAHTLRVMGAQVGGAGFGNVEVQKASLLVFAYPQ